MSAVFLIGIIVLLLMVILPVVFIASLVLLLVTKNKAWLFGVIPSGILGLFLVALMGLGLFLKMNEIKKENVSAEKVPVDRVVTSTDGKARVKLPMHWRLLKNLNDDAQLQAGNLAREEYLMVINELKSDFEGTLEEYGALVSDNLKDALKDAEMSGPEKITVNGVDALQYEVSGSINNVSIAYLLTAVEGPESFHQISEWTLKSKEGTAFPIFQEVLQTFTPVVASGTTGAED